MYTWYKHLYTIIFILRSTFYNVCVIYIAIYEGSLIYLVKHTKVVAITLIILLMKNSGKSSEEKAFHS